MTRQYHIQLEEGECAPYVLLPGDPGRVEQVASVWDESHQVAENREYVTYTGIYKGVPITCTSTGIGGPSTAIAVEELARVGARTFLRIGTCGTFKDEVKDGDMVIFDAAARFDGASLAYAPLEFPAAAHYDVVCACIQAAENLGIPYHVGLTRTHDGLYARQPNPAGPCGVLAVRLGASMKDLQHEHHCFEISGGDLRRACGAAGGRYGGFGDQCHSTSWREEGSSPRF